MIESHVHILDRDDRLPGAPKLSVWGLRTCHFGQFLFDFLNSGEAVLVLLLIRPNYIQSASAMFVIRCKEVGKFLAQGSGFHKHLLIGHHVVIMPACLALQPDIKGGSGDSAKRRNLVGSNQDSPLGFEGFE